MPSACLLALTTIIAAFQRMKARMRRSMCSSPGNHGSCSRGIVLTYGVLTVAGKLTWLALARSSSFDSRKRARVLPCMSTTASRRVEPLLRLVGIGVGELMDVAVEDHGRQSRRVTDRYHPAI